MEKVRTARLERALAGALAQADLTAAEARAFDAAIADRIESAVHGADFSNVPAVNSPALSVDLRRRLIALGERADGHSAG